MVGLTQALVVMCRRQPLGHFNSDNLLYLGVREASPLDLAGQQAAHRARDV